MDLTIGDTQFLIKEGGRYGLLRNQLAYVLATVWHETGGRMIPLVENLNYSAAGLRKTFPKYFTEAQAKQYARNPEAIANRAYANRMGNGNEASGDGWRYRGHSYPQVTGKGMYRTLGTSPEAVMRKEEGARVLFDGMTKGLFTGHKLSDYITLQKSNFVGARRIVNGVDAAEKIAGYARSYDADLLRMGYGVENEPVTTKPDNDVEIVKVPEPIVADPGELEANPATSKTTLMNIFTIIAAPVAAFAGLDRDIQLALIAVIVLFGVYAVVRRFDLARAVRDLKKEFKE